MFDFHRNQKVMPSVAINIGQIKNLFVILKTKTNEALDEEVATIKAITTLSPEEIQTHIDRFKEQYSPFVIFYTKPDGEILVRGDDPFASQLIVGKKFLGISIKCDPMLGGSLAPKIAYEVLFDFTVPSIYDWNNGVSEPTLNMSRYNVVGTDDTYVSSTLNKIEKFLDDKRLARNWLHIKYIYDIGLFFIALPLGFVFSFAAMDKINLYVENMPTLAVNMLYFYFFIIILQSYRFLVGYTKWIWPKIENKEDSPSLGHRLTWSAIILGLIISGITEGLKFLILIMV